MKEATGKRLAALSLGAIGVVYGDIGTSPIYALKEVFFSTGHSIPLTQGNVLGVLSLIFWVLTIVVAIKYAFVILRADNQGEGGAMVGAGAACGQRCCATALLNVTRHRGCGVVFW
jgi:KUP system potassium uptake protein